MTRFIVMRPYSNCSVIGQASNIAEARRLTAEWWDKIVNDQCFFERPVPLVRLDRRLGYYVLVSADQRRLPPSAYGW